MLYADEPNLFIQGNELQTLCRATVIMSTLCNWLTENIPDPQKTEYSIFHLNRTRIPHDCDHVNFNINRVANSKYLGIVINDALIWDSHFNHILGQLVK